MVGAEAPEYSEPMNPTGAMGTAGRAWWPTSCRVCHRWQTGVLCFRCLEGAGLSALRCTRCALRLPSPARHTFLPPDDDGLCQACRDAPPGFDHACAVLDYAEPWSSLIASLKFQDDTAMADVLARLMAPSLLRRWQVPGGKPASPRDTRRRQRALWKRGAPSVIVPVPLSAARLKERGYNQAWLLASQTARELGWANRLHPHTLVRQRETGRLMAMQSDERQRSIQNAFAVSPEQSYRVVGQHIALVDDVMTTGATANEAARTLLAAGAASVTGWFAARTPAPAKNRSPSIKRKGQSIRPAIDTPKLAK